MPALFTHYKFGIEVLNTVNNNLRNKLNNNEIYIMFNQGFDNLYYYLPKRSYYRSLGIRCHYFDFDKFIYNGITYIKNNNLENNKEIIGMLFGILNHYILDNFAHPYINAQVKLLDIPHTKMEFIIDSKVRHKMKGNYYRKIIPKIKTNKLSNNYLKFVDYIFLETYNEGNISNIIFKSHNISYYLYKYLINDKYGIKTSIYRFIDYITKYKYKLSKDTFYVKKFDKTLLNMKKIEWTHPDNKNEKYTYNFLELYNYAFKLAIELDNTLYDILYNNKDYNKFIDTIKEINIKNIPILLP